MKSEWIKILKRIFEHEAIIIIVKGFWKHGKTNVALKLMEDCLEIGIIQIGATNIRIKESDKIRFIEDMPSLKEFHYDDSINPKHKMYIFDEAGKLALRRSAMSKENREWMKFIPELSKGRMKLVVVTQQEFMTDSIFTETEFTRAVFTASKHEKYGYSIGIESELLDTSLIYIQKFPKCKIKYMPYGSAEFYLERKQTTKHEFLCCEIARLYGVNDTSSTIIANQKKITRKQVTRLIKRHIRHTLGNLTKEDIQEIRDEGKTPTIEKTPLKLPIPIID